LSSSLITVILFRYTCDGQVPVYRLPVREHFPSCTNTVLNIDSVVKALCSFATHHDWARALHNCVPLRKLSADDAAALGAQTGTRWRRRKEKEDEQAAAKARRAAALCSSAGTVHGLEKELEISERLIEFSDEVVVSVEDKI
jgi:hypothetical protein